MRWLMFTAVVGLFVSTMPAVEVSPMPRVADERFHDELKGAAKGYRLWGRLDDENHWAPGLCRAPIAGKAHESESADEETHGKKLYSLFAKDSAAYLKLFVKRVPWEIPREGKAPLNPPLLPAASAGQVIVKESWVPREATEQETVAAGKTHYAGGFNPYAWRGKKLYKADKQADLFIMLKLDPKTPGTDEGWVYGTVTPDGKTVTSAGKVGSCMKCHVEAMKDRLFGPSASSWIMRDR